jgi:hypothetical protein
MLLLITAAEPDLFHDTCARQPALNLNRQEP